jgi:hypothetical protein
MLLQQLRRLRAAVQWLARPTVTRLLHAALQAHFCDSLALLRQQRACASGGGDASLVQLQEEWASDAEAALLQQLHALPCRASIVPTWHWAAGGAHARIGFAFVHHLTTQPLLPGAATMTLAELAASDRATVKELALLLHVVEAGGAPPTDECSGGGGGSAPAPAPFERLKALLLQHYHCHLSLEQCGREQMVAQWNLVNCETGKQLPAADCERHRWVAQRLQLSRLQRREIAVSLQLAQQLLAPVRHEAGELRALLAGAGDSTHDGGGGGGGGPSVEERQQWVLRLSTLARKVRAWRRCMCTHARMLEHLAVMPKPSFVCMPAAAAAVACVLPRSAGC